MYDILEIPNFAYKVSFTFKNILSGFKSTGICPINHNIFDENDFLASRVSHETKIAATNLSHPDLFAGKDTSIQESIVIHKNVDQPDTFLSEQESSISAQETTLSSNGNLSVRPYSKYIRKISLKQGGRKPGKTHILKKQNSRWDKSTKFKKQKKIHNYKERSHSS